jgi:hypothetical protein
MPPSDIISTSGTDITAQLSENKTHWVYTTHGVNGHAYAISKDTLTGYDLGICAVGFATSEGATIFEGDQLKELVFLGGNWVTVKSFTQTKSLPSDSCNWGIFKGGSFLMVGRLGIHRYDTKKKRNSSKAVIRMLKATV